MTAVNFVIFLFFYIMQNFKPSMNRILSNLLKSNILILIFTSKMTKFKVDKSTEGNLNRLDICSPQYLQAYAINYWNQRLSFCELTSFIEFLVKLFSISKVLKNSWLDSSFTSEVCATPCLWKTTPIIYSRFLNSIRSAEQSPALWFWRSECWEVDENSFCNQEVIEYICFIKKLNTTEQTASSEMAQSAWMGKQDSE